MTKLTRVVRHKATGEIFLITGSGMKISYGFGPEAEKKALSAKKRNNNRIAKEDAYESCGMVKVKGALGGTYWE